MVFNITDIDWLSLEFDSYEKLISFYRNIPKEKYEQNSIYIEKHHILPKCLGGDNAKANLVYLPWMAHTLAHFLLAKQLENLDEQASYKNYLAVRMILNHSNEKSIIIENLEDLKKVSTIKAIELETNNKLNYKRVFVKKEGERTTLILEKDLPKYIKEGWSKGRFFKNSKGKVWVNDGCKSYQIDKDKLSQYLENGYKKGMYRTEAMKEYNHSNRSTNGRIAIHKGPVKKYVEEKELNSFLEEGWLIGTGQQPRLGAIVSEETKRKISEGVRRRLNEN